MKLRPLPFAFLLLPLVTATASLDLRPLTSDTRPGFRLTFHGFSFPALRSSIFNFLCPPTSDLLPLNRHPHK